MARTAIAVATDNREKGDSGAVSQVWALFDRDQHTDIPEAFACLREHNTTARTAGRGQIQVAFSNPSFDLWLLLHFQQLSAPQGGSSDQVHWKLRAYPSFQRFATGSGSKAITAERALQLTTPEHIENAVRNARALVKQCQSSRCSSTGNHTDGCDPLHRDPSTDVWRLVESLGILPG